MKRGKTKRGSLAPKANGLSQLFKFAAYGTLGLGAVANSTAETVITFEGFTTPNSQDFPFGYGDNVSANSADWTVRAGRTGIVGTPDITLDWVGSGWDTYIDWNGRGSVGQTDFNEGSLLSIVFTPSGFWAVRLASFELDEWVDGGAGAISWTIAGSVSGQRASEVWTMTTAGGRSAVLPDVTGFAGESLTLTFTLTSGSPSYFAMDNLTFDQVPEPSTWALGALGAAALGAAAMRRRRRA